MTRKEREEYKRLFKEGTIGLLTQSGQGVAHYWAKVYDEPSCFGIEDGRISKLMIKVDGRTTLSYDRGWEIEPDENDLLTMTAFEILKHDYN